MIQQQLETQKGEVQFRRKLYQQQVEGKTIFADEYDAQRIEKILRDRMNKTFIDMSALQQSGTRLSPYIEIGAERGQRSLVMENRLGGHGAAVDISFDLVKSAAHYGKVFNLPNSPLRVCCDANTLPFLSKSVPFVFCYETLHHFPEPAPITKEIFRVLQSGGHFFFDEEPFRQMLHFNLYKAKQSYSAAYRSRSFARRVADKLFMQRSCNETDHGILENNKITLRQWKTALADFDASEVSLRTGPIATAFVRSNLLKYAALYLTGGNISGLCRKPGTTPAPNLAIEECLACPSCRERGVDSRLRNARCPVCSSVYRTVDGVLVLLTKQKLVELYPEFA